MAQDKQLTDVDTIAFKGGQDTYHEPGLLAPGSFSLVQNMRQMHPGLKQRLGYIKKHSTADGTNGVLSMFQFSKGKRVERHFYAQMSDNDILEATDAPPTVTTGVFGTEVFSGNASPVPASWSVLDDLCIFSDGVDQHQICAGDNQPLQKFIVYDTDTPLSDIPSIGYDYTEKVNDSDTSTVAVLDSLGNYSSATGTVTCSGTTVTGTSTLFLTELIPGMNIKVSNYSSQYPTQDTDHVKATDATHGAADNATDPSLSLTGAYTSNSWLANATANMRFHIDLGSGKVITHIYYENYHTSGSDTNTGAKTFTFWGSNEASAFAELTYGTDTNWTQLTCSQTTFDQHAAANAVDPKYIRVTNSTSYQYYAVKIADNWGGVDLGLRRIELQTANEADEIKQIDSIASNTVLNTTTSFSAHSGTSFLTATHDSLMLCTPVMPNKYTFTVSKPNGNASVISGCYYSATGWKTLTITDNTVTAGATLAKSGTLTWTTPTDAVPKYMYEKNGFWVRLTFSAPLDSEVEISQVTCGSTFVPLQDVWDGSLVDAIEGIFYDQSGATFTLKPMKPLTGGVGGGSTPMALSAPTKQYNFSGATKTKYFIYGTSSITINSMTSSDYVYFNSPDPIVGLYIDVGVTPNTTASTLINSVQYMASSGSWTSVGAFTDGTSGISKSGFVTFGRQSDISQNVFQGSIYASYWYRFAVDKTLSATVAIGIQVIPYFDINNYGIGICNAIWNHRAVYAFDKYPNYIILSAPNNPQVLSSTDSAEFPVGDGRANKIVCMKSFYDELIIAQEERGSTGGCITMLSKPTDETSEAVGVTRSVSTYYGTMNSQSMEVVETDEGHRIFFLSRNGIMMSDGKEVIHVPNFDKVMNYFDSSNSSCIRTGYESKMYLRYDSVYRVLKIGLTTGSSATNNNVFLVYDIISKDFMCDTYANNFSCEYECEAGSGNVPVVRLAGGQADGFIYILNSGLNDISTAVDAQVIMEINNKGKQTRDGEMVVRAKTQVAGDMVVTPYRNGVVLNAAKTLSLTAERQNDRMRKHRFSLNWVDQNISVKFAHNTVSESFYLLDYGVNLIEYSQQ